MHNLFRMSSLASLEGQLGKWPRMDRELLSTYSEGLIATSGCPSGEIQVRLRLGQWEEAVRAAADMQDIFGKENYYIELMDHGLDIERRVTKQLLELRSEERRVGKEGRARRRGAQGRKRKTEEERIVEEH